ncbi:hypothetical protein BT96DRAFT_992960 [Gymnopus androsaceus JB14]|uniref:Mid2 domain-containing protein n=1 Tax=Gymnopus androsaceus JB14 TaxID=1447944 RepID=A0A6A4HU09_9AGAR|nr:hypothetical protein BT96DRAFT_992960 [Gymnopus androsaceus JB14]
MFFSVLNGSDSFIDILESLGGHNGIDGTNFTWTVDIAAGQSIVIEVDDSESSRGKTNPLVVQAGTSSSCLNGSASSTGSSSLTTSSSSSTSHPAGTGTSSSTSSAKKIPIGAIVGGVIGSIVLIFVVLFVLLMLRKRRRHHAEAGIQRGDLNELDLSEGEKRVNSPTEGLTVPHSFNSEQQLLLTNLKQSSHSTIVLSPPTNDHLPGASGASGSAIVLSPLTNDNLPGASGASGSAIALSPPTNDSLPGASSAPGSGMGAVGHKAARADNIQDNGKRVLERARAEQMEAIHRETPEQALETVESDILKSGNTNTASPPQVPTPTPIEEPHQEERPDDDLEEANELLLELRELHIVRRLQEIHSRRAGGSDPDMAPPNYE